jgi:hypothetical protein
MAEKGEPFEGFTVVRVYRKEVKLKGCPRSHIGEFTNKWIALFRWLDKWGTTPMQMGAPVNRVQPKYFEIMELISDTLARDKDDGANA